MSETTGIQWTDATFNPWWGCTKVSPACDHCYAERDAKRYASDMVLWGDGSMRRTFGEKHWQQPIAWNKRAERAGKRLRVFCASMADVFDKEGPEDERKRLWATIAATPWLDWQLLTKRIGNVAHMVPPRWMTEGWPANVQLGISVVTQGELERDLPKLRALSPRIAFLSCEPLLEPINLLPHLHFGGLDWVIIGGESGPGARPFDPQWALDLVRQCQLGGAWVFVKQMGARPVGMKLRDRKGGDASEWPVDLRVRETPIVAKLS